MVDAQQEPAKMAASKAAVAQHAAASLLLSKLYRPALRPGLVARPRLLAQLQDGWRQRRAVSLVVAPAGYGKSTLVTAWTSALLQAEACVVAWLTLDKNDNDPTRFFTYLVAALDRALPGTGEVVEDLLALLPPPAPETLMAALLDALRTHLAADHDSPARLLLVLDDYHHLRAPALHEAVRLFAENRLPALHLALVTREDPPLPLSRWRVSDNVTEIRAQALRFTEAEAARFLQNRSGQPLEQPWVAALTQRTEGWAAGLQLAALALRGTLPRGAADTAAFVANFSGSHRYVIDYLVDEVLTQLEQPARAFLTGTVVLDRLCAPLCAAVLAGDDEEEASARPRAEAEAQSMLEQLEAANLFLVPLDDRREWYRYHQLFADSLRAELDPAQRAAGHRRAAAWFARERLYPEAIDHAAAAGDTGALVRLVRRAVGPAFRRGRIVQIGTWLEDLPAARVYGDPELGIYRLLSLILTGRAAEAPAVLTTLEAHSEDWEDQRQQARLLAIKAWLADIQDSEERLPLAHAAAAALGTEDPLLSAFVAVPLGHAYLFEGQLDKAIAIYREGLALARQQGATFARQSLLGNLIYTLNVQGRRREAFATCTRVTAEFVDARGRPLPSAAIPHLLRAWLHYDANQLDEAREGAEESQALLHVAFRETLLTPLEIELPVLLYEAAGETEQALAAVRAGQERATRQQYRQAIQAVRRIKADLLLRHDDLAPVRRWAASETILNQDSARDVAQIFGATYDAIYLTYARLLLAEDRAEEAVALLDPLAASAEAGQRGRNLISIRLLQAVAAAAPLPPLLAAVQQAATESYLRLIIDECAFPAHGPRLVALLQQQAVHDAAPAFVDAVLAALPVATATALPEPLTAQEEVVLRLLVAGMSNREIAEELVITVGTAKWHVHNVYQKLNVSSRAEAVARAYEAKLLDS